VNKKVIVLVGNPSEGFAAYGPYESHDAAVEAHPEFDVWVMGLGDPKNVRRFHVGTPRHVVKQIKTKEKSR
jgi:hypothetical protein